MQSQLKEIDPQDVLAIETLLAAHAEKAPPLAHDPAAAVATQVREAPPISIGTPIQSLEPNFGAADGPDFPAESAQPDEIKVDRLPSPGPQPMSRSVKRVTLAVLALLGATAAAGWQQYGAQAKAMALEWTPPFVLAALPSAIQPGEQPNAPEQPNALATAVITPDQAAPQPVAAAAPDQPAPAPPASAEQNQLQAMAQDLAAMNRQVEELKATIAQLKASQAQTTREPAKSSEAKAVEPRPVEPAARPKLSSLAQPQRAAPPPVRKPKPAAATYSPTYTAPPAYTAASAPPAPAQAAAAIPPAPPVQTIADDGQPVVRPPMPLR